MSTLFVDRVVAMALSNGGAAPTTFEVYVIRNSLIGLYRGGNFIITRVLVDKYMIIICCDDQAKTVAIVVCWILGLGCLISWNSMLTIGDYYYKLFPVSSQLFIYDFSNF